MNLMSRTVATAAIGLIAQLATHSAFANPELIKAKNCTACHATDKKILGPSFKDVASKYGSDAKAVETLVARVKGGGSGVWGNIPMPANPQVTDAEAETLVKWILAQK
jgi:cytochrome c